MVSQPCNHSCDWNETPFVSVLVLNWNGKRFLGPCLTSLIADACSHVELVVVDNGSTDGSVEYVREQFPRVRVIAHEKNLGFSRGYNAAVPAAKGIVAVLLNNDTEVERGWLAPLVDSLLADPQVGIATSKVLFYGTDRVNSAGGFLKLWTGGGELGFGEAGDQPPWNAPLDPFYASGAALAMKRELYQRLGGLDEIMFAYGEDFDLSWRARLAGYRVLYCPNSVVHHHFSGTWKSFNPRKVRMVTRHHLRGMVKNLSMLNLLHSLPAFMLFSVCKGLALSVAAKNLAYAASSFLALGDLCKHPGELWVARVRSQAFRKVPDGRALRSAGFGLFATPWHFLRVQRVAKRLGQGERV